MRIKVLMKTIWELDGNTLRKNKKQKQMGEQKQNKKTHQGTNKQKNKVFLNLLKETLIKRNSKGDTSKQP